MATSSKKPVQRSHTKTASNVTFTPAQAVAQRLREAREALGLSQADVVRETGRSKDYISKVERGTLGISIEMMTYYCIEKGIDLSWLVCGRGGMFLKDKLTDGSEDAEALLKQAVARINRAMEFTRGRGPKR